MPATGRKCKQEESTSTTRYNEQVDEKFKELKEKHMDKYSTVNLRLWARMLVSGIYDSMDDPPSIPPFIGTKEKKNRFTLQCTE